MPLRKRSSRPPRAASEGGERARRRSVGAAPLRVAYELGAIAVEIVRIPLGAWLRVAEVAGAAVLAAWRVVWPLARRIWLLAGRFLAAAARVVTPTRVAVAVALF